PRGRTRRPAARTRGPPARCRRAAGALLRARLGRVRRRQPRAGGRPQRPRAGTCRPADPRRPSYRAQRRAGGAARRRRGPPARPCSRRERQGRARAAREDHRGAPHGGTRARRLDGMTLEALARHAWTGQTPGARALRLALVPASAAYRAAVGLRNGLYDHGWLAARRVPARVLSVGNLTVGGTGKTPAALWTAERLAARGHRVGIVARGYRKRRPGPVVVGVDRRALVSAEDGGDEAVMLARRFAGPVVTGERRHEAASLACARFALDTIVLDDGFQHRALARDADLV